MDEALKPCPFCGNDGSGPIEHALHISHTQNDWHSAYDCYSVQCDKCTVSMGYSDNEAEAIAAWNTRPTHEPAPELVERVGRAIEACDNDRDQMARAAIAAMGSPVDEIVAWLRTRAAPHTCTAGMAIADQIEAKWGQK